MRKHTQGMKQVEGGENHVYRGPAIKICVYNFSASFNVRPINNINGMTVGDVKEVNIESVINVFLHISGSLSCKALIPMCQQTVNIYFDICITLKEEFMLFFC